MPVNTDLRIVSINTSQSIALTSNDIVVPITNYINDDGEECHLEDAVCFVAGNDDAGWFGDTLSSFESAETH